MASSGGSWVDLDAGDLEVDGAHSDDCHVTWLPLTRVSPTCARCPAGARSPPTPLSTCERSNCDLSRPRSHRHANRCCLAFPPTIHLGHLAHRPRRSRTTYMGRLALVFGYRVFTLRTSSSICSSDRKCVGDMLSFRSGVVTPVQSCDGSSRFAMRRYEAEIWCVSLDVRGKVQVRASLLPNISPVASRRIHVLWRSIYISDHARGLCIYLQRDPAGSYPQHGHKNQILVPIYHRQEAAGSRPQHGSKHEYVNNL